MSRNSFLTGAPIQEMRYDINGCGLVFPAGLGDTCPKCMHETTVSMGYRVGYHAGSYEWYSCADTMPRELRDRVSGVSV